MPNIGYSHSDDIKQLYYGVSGGVLAHANGVTLGQPLNDTVVLVKAPGAKDAKVENPDGGAYRLARLCRAALCH
ncbi:outer membrane usher protein FimD, truncation [Escherichia coli]|uniref:Outer membrane usher protein FimD, truncation n=1 Tax=Escherichia coli TaxID=562 RepID=A0A376MQ60_ECOLX|nr:outer membrane usher protein FimD, truncation [Escherichia coli]